MTTKPDTSAAATNVAEFMTDLDGGQLERRLSIAISQVACSVMDNDKDKAGDVTLVLKFTRIPGTSQITVSHMLKFWRPTSAGKAGEEETRETVMHVGKFGALSLAQPSLLDKSKQGGFAV